MTFTKILLICAAFIVLTVGVGCASRSQAPDPDELQAKIKTTHAEFRKLIASEIDDPARAKAFAALSDERDRLISQHAEVVQHYSTTMRKLNSDYSSSREDFEQLIRDYNRDRRADQVRFVELIDQMKAGTTEKEWKTLSKFELKELNPRTMSYTTEVH
jgi:hypothetical protein